MKTTFLLILALLITFMIKATGQGIIIDHSCIDVSAIPSNIIDSIKQNKRFQWCGQSHSHQVPSGMKLLEEDFPYLDVTVGDGTNGISSSGGWLPDPNGTFCMMDGLQLFSNNCGNCCLSIYPHEYWNGSNHVANFQRTFVTCFPDINVSGFVWCGELESASFEYVQAYLDTMEAHEVAYPDIQFIYATGHSQNNGSYGYNRHQRNEQIRQYCLDNNKVLFDFGDLDCWSNGEFSYYIYNGDTIPAQHPDYNGNTYHHTNALSCKNKARTVWYMMALLSGWQANNNNNPPQIENQSFNIDENSPNGTTVGTVIAFDPDIGQTLTYSILSGNTNNAFQLNISNGTLTVQNSTELNYESNPVFTLTVQVEDNGLGNLTDQATITINLNDVNEPPIIDPQEITVNFDAFFIYGEINNNFHSIGFVEAYDPDAGQTISFSCVSGNEKQIWSLDELTGEIVMVNPYRLILIEDFSYPLLIEVKDNSLQQLTASAIFTINVHLYNLTEYLEGQNLFSADISVNSTNDLTYKVYPNPSNNNILLEAENIGEGIINLTILNLNGEIVMKKGISSEGSILKDNIDISELSKGMYIINIQIGEAVIFNRFIKK